MLEPLLFFFFLFFEGLGFYLRAIAEHFVRVQGLCVSSRIVSTVIVWSRGAQGVILVPTPPACFASLYPSYCSSTNYGASFPSDKSNIFVSCVCICADLNWIYSGVYCPYF